MDVIFLNTDAGFPVTIDGVIYVPRPVIDGFIFSIDKKDVCDQLGVQYQVKNISEIEFIPYEEPETE